MSNERSSQSADHLLCSPAQFPGRGVWPGDYPDGFRIRTWDAAPAGYGYTTTVSIHDVDSNFCPIEPPYCLYPLLPTGGWEYGYLCVGHDVDRVAIVLTMGPGEDSPVRWATDHPAAGPTGPQAMGTCYPSTRITRSFWYGTTSSPVCPGAPFNDGVGDARLLVDTCFHDYGVGLALESESWGRIKSMHR